MRGSNVLLGLGPVLVLAVGVAACGPEAPPPVTAVAPKPSAEPQKKPPIVEDRSPVEAPAGLVVQAHSVGWKGLVRTLKTWLPATAELDPRALVRELALPVLDRVVDIDKPVDLAVRVLDARRAEFGVAFGVEDGVDVADVVKDHYKLEAQPGGIQLLQPLSGGKAQCALAPALGASKHRVVCTRLGDDPMPLAPWLARGVTRREFASAARVEVDVAALKKTFGSDLEKGRAFARGELASDVQSGYPSLDKAFKPIAKALIDEAFDLVDDLDGLALEANAPADGLEVSLQASFSAMKSWTARLMLAGGDAPTTASPRLAKLPGDGGWLGMFSRQSAQHDALLAPIQAAAQELVTALAADFKWPAKDRELALEVVKLAFPASADTSTVTGHQGQVAWPEGTPKPYGDVARMTSSFFLSKSWSVTAAERPSKSSVGFAKALFALASRPAFADTYRALAKDRLAFKITTRPLAIKELPKGSFAEQADIELLVPGKPAPAPAKGKKPAPKGKDQPLLKLTTEAIVVPDGAARTWSALGHNLPEGELWKRLSGAMAGSTSSPLGARARFGFLGVGAPSSGGLLTLDGLVRSFLSAGKGEKLLGQLPDQGRGALYWRVSSSKPPKAVGELSVFVPRDFITAVFFAGARF